MRIYIRAYLKMHKETKKWFYGPSPVAQVVGTPNAEVTGLIPTGQ